MKLRLLGSGGWLPTSARETCCAYLREDDSVLLIDAGTGLARLVEEPALLAGAERLDVVLTHFHLDHVVGLSYLPALPLRPTLWGPAAALTGTPTGTVLGHMFGSPLFGAELEAIVASVCELPADGRLDVGPWPVAVRRQDLHTDPTLAVRVGDQLTYCTDTAADAANADFARGSGLLFHEAWYADATTDDRTHSAAGEAGHIAATAGVESLVLIHLDPLQRSHEKLLAAAREEFPRTSLGTDLQPLESLLTGPPGPGFG